MIEARIKFFDIAKCGFYARENQQNPLQPLSGITDALVKLNNWARDGRELVNTTTYSVADFDELYRTFFCDWSSNSTNGDSVLILWNEIANENGTVYGMPPQSAPGDTNMLTTDFEGEAIPGMPSYFWFIPTRRIVASITFGHSTPGKMNLERYISGYLANRSPYRIKNTNGDVVGYASTRAQIPTSSRYSPKFKLFSRKNSDVLRDLITNRERITRMIKRETFTYQTQDDRTYIERLFSGLLPNTPEFQGERKISHEFQFQPTAQQLETIVTNFYENQDPAITSAGFIYNDGKTVMLTGLTLTAQIELQIERLENEIISAGHLLRAIMAQRERLLGFAELGDAPAFEIDPIIIVEQLQNQQEAP